MTLTGCRRGELVKFEAEEIRPNKYLAAEAAAAFRAMEAQALADGLGAFIVNEAWRSNRYQGELYERYMRRIDTWVKEGSDPSTKPPPVARPGYSNHQSGIAVDINRSHDNGKTDRWLAENAGKYGFRRTVKSEPWHWEWVP